MNLDAVKSILEIVLPLLPSVVAPYASIAMAIAGVVGNLLERPRDAGPIDEALAKRVLEDILTRNAATLATCTTIEARELAHQAYLRQKLS
jgi:hypothetical protein